MNVKKIKVKSYELPYKILFGQKLPAVQTRKIISFPLALAGVEILHQRMDKQISYPKNRSLYRQYKIISELI